MTWAILGTIMMHAVELPAGAAPDPVAFPHFPDRLHAFVWRNWPLVPTDRLAEVVDATPEQILALGQSMGLPKPPAITKDQQRRSYITVIRRNWHLLPYEQLLTLLGWSAEELAYTLREDDFLYIKLGSLKPKCAPLKYAPPSKEVQARAADMAQWTGGLFSAAASQPSEPLFGFVQRLSKPPKNRPGKLAPSKFTPRYCSSYFALYGDPLLEEDPESGSFPDGYLARLADSGVNGVWMQAVLYKLTPYPWEPSLSEHYEQRLENLAALVARAKKQGVGIYLYMNEPRAMPLSFHEKHPGVKGVVRGDHACMCTSTPEVQNYIRDGIKLICERVPDLAGFFTITASENPTNCWSHGAGKECPRCAELGPEVVIAGVNGLISEGIKAAGSKAQLIAWDWGWRDDWAKGIIERLPKDVAHMSVSEWSIPIKRGGVDSVCGEYSISVVGPGPRAARHWGYAREAGLKTLAKIQANNTWELSSVPYIPAVENVANHAANLRGAHVNGLMLGWTLGGCPSPNLEVVAEMGRDADLTVQEAMKRVAAARVGEALAPALVKAWHGLSKAFSEYPYHIGVMYNAPSQMGPANLLWGAPTGYRSTMVGLPYDSLDTWRAVFPPEVFIGQYEKMGEGFDEAIAELEASLSAIRIDAAHGQALQHEIDVARVCAIHFHSVANQARFIVTRNALASAKTAEAARPAIATLEKTLQDEIALATQMHAIQNRDSRFGFEASNHYFYIPVDLAEKVVNCQDLLTRWLPEMRAQHGL